MTKPKLPCGIHFCPVALRLLWPIKAVRIADIATVYGVGIAETTRRAAKIGVIDQRQKRREPKYSPAEFRRLWADNSLRIRDIAQRFNMVTRCVEAHAAAMKLPHRKCGSPRLFTFPVDFDQIWLSGVTTREIGYYVGCSHNLVSVEAARRKLPARSRSRSVKPTMLAYQMAKSAKLERDHWELAGMVDGKAHSGRWAA